MTPMKVLIACERSGTVRDAFLARGHDAMSCDLESTRTPGPHHQGDVRDVLDRDWDLIIAHPPCTYITNSSVGWLTNTPKNPSDGILYGPARWKALEEACAFFRLFLDAKCPRVVIENPIPHCHAMKLIKTPYTQLIQPWMFGHGETKATCLWLQNAPPLMPTKIVAGREQRLHRLGPSDDRQEIRSKSYQGIADAMADQWGSLLDYPYSIFEQLWTPGPSPENKETV